MANETKTTVAPYDRVLDVSVVMTVIRPRPVVGLGNLLILNPKTPAQPADGQTQPASLSDKLSDTDRMNGILMRKTDTATGAIYREYKNVDAVALE